ncbi:Transmembrane protein [Phytophthora megakarya]|uniref:Transmembrane protein n=1 Tax=Phytophthora megakarya TaxID=4795 RepID=A0A225WBF7_9STRA|nr:Transmembrane protein [Phytophthora megakarya]
MTITGAAPAHYDQNFACCGGCSSSKRADAYNGKLATGSLVFIWDIKLKTNPHPVCTLTFPYDPALNEQVGDRRVRSGQRIGTSYPIDNDYDYLCCEQRGECRASNEDASGKCQCVNRWGFTGDHCQFSVYDVAEDTNDEIFPNATNLSSIDHLLPDLRGYLLSFDYDIAISSASTSDLSSSFLNVLEIGSYRQFGWSAMTYFILAAMFFLFVFIGHVMWTHCCFNWGCRRRNPLAKPKIYSRLQKIVWGTLMMLFFFVSSAAVLVTLLIMHNDIKPLAEAVFVVLNKTLPSNMTTFETNFLSPIDELLLNGYQDSTGDALVLASIQEHSHIDLADHAFLDNQSYAEDVVGKSVFELLDPLTKYNVLYPTINNDSIDCEYMNITQPSVTSRMTIGAGTGCFRCKTCVTMVDLVSEAKVSWRMNIFEVQIDMLGAKRDLKDFSLTNDTLTPSIQSFLDRMHLICKNFRVVTERLAAAYDIIAGEVRKFSLFGLYGLCGLCELAIFLGASNFAQGIRTGKRKVGRATCFVSEIAFLIAIILTGALYTMSVMVQDGIIVLQRLDANTQVFLASAQDAGDVHRLLFDQNFVEATEMEKTLEFSDSLRVPPYPTPATDNPSRFNFTELYDMPDLFALEKLTAESDKALLELFAWNEAFVTDHYAKLKQLALVNSPYNQTLHQTLLNSTILQLMDPDNDTALVTEDDLVEIQNVFNERWRGVSDGGVELNKQIQQQWLFVAQLYYQKQKLEMYVAAVSSIISKIHPLLDELILKTKAMENAEFRLKAPIEFVTDSIRTSKIADCNYNGNCAWFRSAINELFALFQQIVLKAEKAAISCAVSVAALLLATLCTNAFTSRMRRNVIKVYIAD